MAVKQITKIELPGFEQYSMYSFDFSPGFSDSPGSINCEFINESGEYDAIDLSVHAYRSVYIYKDGGEKTSLGFYTIVSSSVKKDNRAKVLSVTLLDKSCELDRHLIALRGEFGYDATAWSLLNGPIVGYSYPSEKSRTTLASSSNQRIIWVGESETPCKENILGAASGTDPCDPCEDRMEHPNFRQLSCDLYYLNNKREYVYSFSELLSAISSKTGIAFSGLNPPESQKFNYSGTVREVLNNICAELGYTFYYSSTNNSVVFVNLFIGISINTKGIESLANKDKILSVLKSQSRENKKDAWGVAAFSKGGEERNYACGINSCKKLTLAPFVLTDILTAPGHFHSTSTPLFNNFKRLEFYSIINNRIGKNFRDLFVWLQEYKITTADKAIELIDDPLYKLNGMTIKKVFSSGSTEAFDKSIYRILYKVNSGGGREAVLNMEKKKTYFFLAKVDEQYENKVNSLENSIASNFLGKYWMRYYKEHWKGLSYSTIQPDGNVTYYDYNAPINLPFADMVYEAYETLQASPLLSRDPIAVGQIGSLTARDTFFLMERDASYWPDGIEDDDDEKIQAITAEYLYKEISIPNELSNKFKKEIEKEEGVIYSESGYRVFMVEAEAGEESEGGLSVDLVISDDIDHPIETENVNMDVQACGRNTSYGLKSSKCRSYAITLGDFELTLHCPVQSYVENTSAGHAGYGILVEKTGDDASYFIPKLEAFAYGQNFQSNSMSIESNLYNATQNDLDYLSQVVGGGCDMDLSKIQATLSSVIGNLNYSTGIEYEESYTLEGLPTDFFYAGDGLRSMNISIGEAGVTTSLAFSNLTKVPEGVDNILKRLRGERLEKLWPIGVTNRNTGGLPEV